MQEQKATGRAAQRAKRQKKRIVLIVAAVLLLAALITGGALIWLGQQKSQGFEKYQFDADAMAGRIQMMSDAEIQEELNRVVEEGMFNISIASAIVFGSPEAEGQARIENVAENRYHMQVDIFLDATGERVYASKLIQPGYSIENIRLEKMLEPGEYSATAVFSAITQKEMQLFGQAAAQIKLYVMDEEGRIPTPTPQPAP